MVIDTASHLEIEPGKTRSRKRNSSESLKVVDERKCSDIDLYVQSLIHTKADVNSTSNPAKESVERKKRKKKRRRSCKADDKDGMQSTEQTDAMSMRGLSDEHHIQGNQDKLKGVEPYLKQEVEGSFVDDENTPSAKLSVGQKKRRRKRRRMECKGNDNDGIHSMDQTDIMSKLSLSGGYHVPGNEDKLNNVEKELEPEVEGSFVDYENTPSAKECVDQKKKGRRARRMKGKANDKDGVQGMDKAVIMSMGSLSDEHREQGKEDKLKRVEHVSEQEVGGPFVDDENTPSAKESAEQKKKERRRRRMERKANDKAGTQIMDQTDIMSMRSLSHEHHVQEHKDKPKRVEHELDQEVEGSVLDDENTPSAKESAEPKKKGRRRRMKREANGKDDIQSMDQTDVMSIRSLSNDYQVQGNKDELERVEPELEQEVERSFMDGENTPPAKECVEAKKKGRRRRKNRKANANNGMQSRDQTDVGPFVDPSAKHSGMERPSSNADVAKHDKVDNLLKASHPSPETTLVSFSRRKLLVLDVNGLLADIVHPPPKHCKSDINISRRAIFKRPFYYDFLKFCFERFDVGIWSSRSKRIIDLVVDYLLGDMKHKLRFCWDLSYCTTSGYFTLENMHKPLVFKELRKIWENRDPNFPWVKGDYDESNTLLLDDSPYKALINPKHTAIFPRSYTFVNRRDNSLGPDGDLRVYLEQVAAAENIQKYVEQHPFGQVGIDETSRSWDFYSRVLSSRGVVPASTEK